MGDTMDAQTIHTAVGIESSVLSGMNMLLRKLR